MILAIDTSAAVAVSAVTSAVAEGATVDPGSVLAHRSVVDPRGHVERLGDFVQQVLQDAGEDVEAVVVGTGPAPFTGLRVGLMTARTLAHAWGVPVHGVCSLDALGAQHGGAVTVVTDARRREVYWASYTEGMRVDGPGVAAAEAVPAHGDVVGRGAELYPQAFPGAQPVDLDPAWLARVALRELAAGRDLPVEPLYLRRPDVHGAPPA